MKIGKRTSSMSTWVHHLWLFTVSSMLTSSSWIHRAKTKEATTSVVVTISESILTTEFALAIEYRLEARGHFTQFTGYILKLEKYCSVLQLHRRRHTCPASSSILISRPALDQFSRVTNEIAYPKQSPLITIYRSRTDFYLICRHGPFVQLDGRSLPLISADRNWKRHWIARVDNDDDDRW